MAQYKSLVTGGAGFIGSHVVDHLLKAGHHLVVLDDLSGGFTKKLNEEAEFVKGSILDEALIEELFRKHQFDYVFHLAAYAAEGLSHFIRKFNYSNNVIGSVNLINASIKHGIKRFVFTSSIAVYGTGELPLTEQQTPNPEDPYGIAKYAVELDLKTANDMFGLDFTIFRPHNVYGERQNIGDPYRNVIGIFMNQILKGKPLTIFGNGEQSRAFSYIDDVAPFIAKSVALEQTKNQVYNIGADSPTSLNTLVYTLEKVVDKKLKIEHLPERKEVIHAYADHSKFAEAFGNNHEYTSLKNGLQQMWQWVKKNGARTSQKFEGIEIETSLPPSWKALL